MKITLKLPGGGELRYEKKPMSDDARYTMQLASAFFGFLLFMLVMCWMFR